MESSATLVCLSLCVCVRVWGVLDGPVLDHD